NPRPSIVLIAAAGEIAGITQYWINNHCGPAIVTPQPEADFVVAIDHILARDGDKIGSFALIDPGLLLNHITSSGFQDQVAISVNAQAFCAGNLKLDLFWIGTGRNHEVIFQFMIVAVKNQIDSGIEAAIAHARINWNLRPPLIRPAHKVIDGP